MQVGHEVRAPEFVRCAIHDSMHVVWNTCPQSHAESVWVGAAADRDVRIPGLAPPRPRPNERACCEVAGEGERP